MKRAKAFYCRVFGFRAGQDYKIAGLGLTICILKKDAVALELFAFKKPRLLPKYRRELISDLKTVGIKHFCFEARDIEAEFRRLKKAKVRLATPMRVFDNGKRYFFVKDPDGSLIEIMEA